MGENGRQLIRELIKGGLKRAEIKEELINAGYDPTDVEKGLDFAYLVSEVGSLKPENFAAPPRNIAPSVTSQNLSVTTLPQIPSANARPQAVPPNSAPKPKSHTFAIAIIIILAVGAIFYAFYY